MANYYASARTNYFAVTDLEAFKADIESKTSSVQVVSQEKDGLTLVGLLGCDDDGGGFPFEYEDEDGEYVELDWAEIFKAHLEEGWVAIIMESGAEKLRYIAGYAVAYNSKGETVSLNLDDIYGLAKSLGSNITEATY
jgi:diaminopimelate decarboxylase